MRTVVIVEVEIAAQRATRLGDSVIGFEIHLFVFDGLPQPLDENVVAPSAPCRPC